MAEGWVRALRHEEWEAHSAGLKARGLDPLAVKVMAEAGVDIGAQRSKTLQEFAGNEFDLAVTVCGGAHESCPVFPSAKRTVHCGFDDPPALAKNAAEEEEALKHYRRVRDEIREFVRQLR